MRGVEQIPWLYDAGMRVMEALGFREWRRRLVGGARGRTLEVGAGTGRNLPLYPPGTRLVALELDPAAVVRARERAPAVPLVVGDVEALPFRDGAFDTAVSALVFCSVGDPLRGLGEVRRVLRDDGELRMIEHVRAERPVLAAVQDRIQPLWTRVAGGCHPNRDTEGTVRRAGFEIDPVSRHASGTMRRFTARPRG
jgi:ubiquinone/menaquinone biosynthesis C-methylase UbiE